jgi:hypothetical protein
MDETTRRVSELLHEAAEVHHVVYRITDGADEDWASFYADWLVRLSELGELLGGTPVRSHLTAELLACDADFAASDGAVPWEELYARRLRERFGAGVA